MFEVQRRFYCFFLLLFGIAGSLWAKPVWVKNQGQFDMRALAVLDLPNTRIFVEKDRLSFVQMRKTGDHESDSAHFHAFQMVFEGANPIATPRFSQLQSQEKRAYFLGKDPTRWVSQAQLYEVLALENLYPGIDLRLICTEEGIKYEFILQAGTHPSQIQIQYLGLDSLWLDEDGKLQLQNSASRIQENAPYSYWKDEPSREVKSSFILKKNRLQFSVKGFAGTLPKALVIDPQLVFSTYSGSLADNFGFTATFDRRGDIYGGGIAFGPGYPVSLGAWDASFHAATDVVVSSWSTATPSSKRFATYIGGNDDEVPMSMVADSLLNLYLLIRTSSNDFPVTAAAFNTVPQGNADIAIVKLNPTGSALLASGILGGAGNEGLNSASNAIPNRLNYNYGDDARGEIYLDNHQKVWVVSNTTSSLFPVTPGAFRTSYRGRQAGFITRFDASLSTIEYSSLICSNLTTDLSYTSAYGITVLPSGKVYVSCGTTCNSLPTTPNALQTTYSDSTDAYILGLDASGQFLYGTYYGTPKYDQAYFIQSDRNKRIYIFGQSRGNFPVTPNVFSNPNGKQFILCVDSTLATRQFSTVIGNHLLDGKDGPDISPTAFLVDNCNRIYLSGWGGRVNRNYTGNTHGLTVTANAFQSTTDSTDFYLAVLEENASNLLYATFMGGPFSDEHVDGGTSRFDKKGAIYQAVCAGCESPRYGFVNHSDFPMANADSIRNNSSNCNLVVFKFNMNLSGAFADFEIVPTRAVACVGMPFQFNNLSSPNCVYSWTFGDGTGSSLFSPTHTYADTGWYEVKLVVRDTLHCLSSDSIVHRIRVNFPSKVRLTLPTQICQNQVLQLQPSGAQTYLWNSSLVSGPAAGPFTLLLTQNLSLTLIGIDTSGCRDTLPVSLAVVSRTKVFPDTPSTICLGDSIRLNPLFSSSTYNEFHWIPDPDIADTNALNPKIGPRSNRFYVLRLRTPSGCWFTDTVWMNVKVVVQVFTDTSILTCRGKLVSLKANSPQSVRWLWSDGSTGNTLSVRALSDTLVWVRAYQGVCESLIDSIRIRLDTLNVRLTVQPDTVYAPGQARFTAFATKPVQFYWNVDSSSYRAGTGNQFTFWYDREGNYLFSVTAVDTAQGCTDTLRIRVPVRPVNAVLPTAFTPDGDGLNDVFRLLDLNIRDGFLRIYSRWGELMFETQDPKEGWDGTYKGKPMPPDLYIAIVRTKGKNDLPFDFTVSFCLIR